MLLLSEGYIGLIGIKTSVLFLFSMRSPVARFVDLVLVKALT